MTAPVPDRIVCAGRPLDDNNQPTGEPCGAVFHRACILCDHWDTGALRMHADNIAEQARAAGWRIGPPRPDGTRDATCRRCSRADTDTRRWCIDTLTNGGA